MYDMKLQSLSGFKHEMVICTASTPAGVKKLVFIIEIVGSIILQSSLLFKVILNKKIEIITPNIQIALESYNKIYDEKYISHPLT